MSLVDDQVLPENTENKLDKLSKIANSQKKLPLLIPKLDEQASKVLQEIKEKRKKRPKYRDTKDYIIDSIELASDIKRQMEEER